VLCSKEVADQFGKFTITIGTCVADPYPDPDWIGIQRGLQIRNPDLDPGGHK
jgi:hypothetical protein